jgi:hypothetical protein
MKRGRHEPSSRIVPHEDEHLVLGNGLHVFFVQQRLRVFSQHGLVLLEGIGMDLHALQVEQDQRPLVLDLIVDLKDLVPVVPDSPDQIGVGALLPFRFRHRYLLDSMRLASIQR